MLWERDRQCIACSPVPCPFSVCCLALGWAREKLAIPSCRLAMASASSRAAGVCETREKHLR